MVIPNRPMHATTVLNQNIPARAEGQQSGMESKYFPLAENPIWRLTVRKEGSDETGSSSYDVGGGKGKASANAFDGEQDE